MISRPRSILFWLILIVLLFLIFKAPEQVAHTFTVIYRAIAMFFESLGRFVSSLSHP
ncbi:MULTISPECIES: hypothetical protein [Streptomyces]|uniref:hypothetical protein n=1 Tax=Streptomyces TaxID=1883 RepID=UPI000AAF9A9F|nr:MULTISPECIES: hypothetical protein [Streptomyces]